MPLALSWIDIFHSNTLVLQRELPILPGSSMNIDSYRQDSIDALFFDGTFNSTSKACLYVTANETHACMLQDPLVCGC